MSLRLADDRASARRFPPDDPSVGTCSGRSGAGMGGKGRLAKGKSGHAQGRPRGVKEHATRLRQEARVRRDYEKCRGGGGGATQGSDQPKDRRHRPRPCRETQQRDRGPRRGERRAHHDRLRDERQHARAAGRGASGSPARAGRASRAGPRRARSLVPERDWPAVSKPVGSQVSSSACSHSRQQCYKVKKLVLGVITKNLAGHIGRIQSWQGHVRRRPAQRCCTRARDASAVRCAERMSSRQRRRRCAAGP